jgi:hypothetical protein
MSNALAAAPHRPHRTYVWWVVLCLVGLDYFSSLAYLPSIAVGIMGEQNDLAPLAAAGVVLVTLLAALPVYWYVVGRSPHGHGGVGLLGQVVHGWTGKLLILFLLGFIATDFVITRSLSISDASAHIVANPVYRDTADLIKKKETQDKVREVLPPILRGRFYDFWNEQLVVAVLLSLLAFALYFFLVTTLSRGFISVAAVVVVLYLLVNAVVIGGALSYLFHNPDLLTGWEHRLRPNLGDIREETGGPLRAALRFALLAFPPMAIGLSGFELSLAAAPMIDGGPGDREENPRGRIRRARLLLLVAALIMSVLVLSSVFVVTLLVPPESDGITRHRALSYLAHGQDLRPNPADAEHPIPASEVVPMAGKAFGTLYDLSTILILCLAGASATISFKDVVPDFLSRFGMQLVWAHKVGVIMHLFNAVILLVTVLFAASVEHQQWAYAASVLALLFGASLAASLDVRQRLHGFLARWFLAIPFSVVTVLFAAMGVLIVFQQAAGVAIALAFVFVVLITAIVSRWLRSTEMRFEGFGFADEPSQKRWEQICQLEFQVLVPHDPTGSTLRHKEEMIRQRHRLGPDVPIIFVEVKLGDPSDFYQKPVLKIDQVGGEEVIRVTHATSVAHVLAAIGLAFREVGHPPELHFGWSNRSPMAANLDFLLLGQGNIPWMVHTLLNKGEANPARRPRVIVG